ncbi:mechanosensitive ion channel [Candidatus Halobeggiatoa sp. HSG11]|nr:mechanosensitive ion channel [Candidatus Halobeggiatoa sp. HSG11]
MYKAIILLLIFISSPSFSASSQPQNIESELLQLHYMTNEELLKQAQLIYDSAYSKLLAELRGVFGNERLLEQASKETKNLSIPSENIPVNIKLNSLETAKLILDHQKERLDAFKQHFKLIEAEKSIVEKQIVQIESAQSATDIFSDRLEDLELFILETKLRIDDGTLVNNEIPLVDVDVKKRELTLQQNKLARKASGIQRVLTKIISRLEKVNKNIIKAETIYSGTKEKYSQELKRQKVEHEYSKQNSKELLAEISKLQEERIWINGTFNLSHRRFKNHQQTVSKLEQTLTELSSPNTTELYIDHIEEAQQAAELATKIVNYHVDKIKKLQNLNTNLQLLIEYGESLEGDGAVLSEHLFKMLIISRTLDKLVNKETINAVPEHNRPKKLAIVGDKITKQISSAVVTIEKARKRQEQVAADIKKSRFAKNEVQEKLINLNKIFESTQQTRQWESELQGLTTEQVLQDFQKNSDQFNKNKQDLQQLRKKFTKAQNVVEEAKLSLESLTDYLLRAAQKESIGEKQNILKTLYKFAGLNLPVTEKMSVQAKDISIGKKRPYQDLLSNRTRIIDEQQKQRIKLLRALNTLYQKITQYVDMLSKISQIASQRYANAVELKKRLGRGELDNDTIPDNITGALKTDIVSQFGNETTKIINYQVQIQQQIFNLSKQDEIFRGTQALLSLMQNIVGRRIDLIAEQKKLDQELKREISTLSNTKLKALEQAANRRMESEYYVTEFLLSFIPSERADNLVELMQAYYLELMELQNKYKSLRTQKKKIEYLTELAENEKVVINRLLPLLQQQKAKLIEQKEEAWAKIKIQLMPERANEIISNFEAKTGQILAMPVLEEEKVIAIEKAADFVFDWHVKIIAIDKWSALFKKRLSPVGVNVEIGNYQDQLGTLSVKNSTILRRVKYISNQSLKGFIQENKTRVVDGEIGNLRTNIYQIRTQQALLVFVRLISILLVSILIIWITNFIVNKILHHSKQAVLRQTDSLIEEKPISTFIILLPLLRTIFIFLVLTIAVILGLSTLGFHAGTVLAGLGIGGLAIAMASQKTLSDVIGGISILLARSFKIGDIILHNGTPTTIEDISLRYTKLREYLTDYLHTIPNSLLSEQQLTNISASKPEVYRTMELPLSVGNSADKIELAMQIIMEVVGQHPETSLRWMRFDSFADYTFTIKASFGVMWKQKDRVQTEVYTEVVRRLQQNGIEFTFPV